MKEEMTQLFAENPGEALPVTRKIAEVARSYRYEDLPIEVITMAKYCFLMLRSLKAITKEATVVAMVLGRSTPDPGIGAPIELSGRDASGLLNFIGVGKALPSERIASEEAPPALL